MSNQSVQTPGTRVCYFYDSYVGNYFYGEGHPMKPHRIRMAHSLILNYHLYKKMKIYRPRYATDLDMKRFHTDDYIDFLHTVSPETIEQRADEAQRFNVVDDCPAFDGMYEFGQISAGGSLGAAAKLNAGDVDIAINWAGGLHHAKKNESSGFCYVNDIVLGILELLRVHQRVLYVDIDIHHGDGVEEAFYTTDRVMCASFHKFGEYFPGTGDIRDIGGGKGKHYSVNFPLKDGLDDESFGSIFKPVIQCIMDWYRPNAIVLQCGADSLSGDRLGCFNLSIEGHASALRLLKSYNLPLMMLGGGGYTIRNVARCWTLETAIALNTELDNNLPYNDYYEYYGPDYHLQIVPSNMKNLNTPEYLEDYKVKLIETLRHLPGAPSAQMARYGAELPTPINDPSAVADAADPDVRNPNKATQVQRDNELSDSEDEGMGGRRDHTNYRPITAPLASEPAEMDLGDEY